MKYFHILSNYLLHIIFIIFFVKQADPNHSPSQKGTLATFFLLTWIILIIHFGMAVYGLTHD